MSDTLPTLQAEDLKALLDSDSYFTDLPVILEDEGDALTEVTVATGVGLPKEGQTKFGACVLVRQPVGRDRDPGVQFGPFDLEWSIVALENRLLNKDTAHGGTGKRALSIARRIARLWKPYRAGGLSQNFKNFRIEPANLRVVSEATQEETLLIGYAVKAIGPEADTDTYERCGPVVISGTASAVTLTCPTAGATIYWTFDANLSHPWSGNDEAVAYTGTPIALTGSGVLRARAFKDGLIAGDVAAAKFT